MMKNRVLTSLLLTALATAGVATVVHASDHDDGVAPNKVSSVNLTDHFVFKTPGQDGMLTLIMNFNPRSLPGFPYFMNEDARYEFHVSRAASRTAAPTGVSDIVLRFEATGMPGPDGVQPVKFSVRHGDMKMGEFDGSFTNIGASRSGNVTTNTGTIDGHEYQFFVGMREDPFHFDVIRFFQVRDFLAARFFGGANGNGNAGASLAPNCEGEPFGAALVGAPDADADGVNLFNPPSCAVDFTKNYNVTSIVLNVPIAALQGDSETVFDTWSTISLLQ